VSTDRWARCLVWVLGRIPDPDRCTERLGDFFLLLRKQVRESKAFRRCVCGVRPGLKIKEKHNEPTVEIRTDVFVGLWKVF
jgi:hypothetical protein